MQDEAQTLLFPIWEEMHREPEEFLGEEEQELLDALEEAFTTLEGLGGLEEDDGTFSIVGYFHDLTEIKAHVDALVAANRELERLNRYYLEMLSFVTHELKSPIANGFMSANALRQEIFGPLLPEQRAMVDAICANLDQSMEMIRHYLDLSRIEKDEFAVHPRPVKVAEEVIEPVLSGLEPALREKAMHLEKKIARDLSWTLDPELFRGVLTNLLSNAVKYGEMKAGSVFRLL